MTIDKHGHKMTGLKKASGQTANYGLYSPEYQEIFYDKVTGEVWTVYQYSLGHNSWTEYHDPNVVKICNTSMHLTMQEIADEIAEKMSFLDMPEVDE